LTPDQAAELLAEGRKLLPPDAAPSNTLATEFRQREAALERIAKRPASVDKLRGWLREPLFNVWAVAKKNGDVVYSAKAPLLQSAGTVTFEKYVDVMKGTTAGATREAVWHGLAPHAVYCQSVLRDLEDDATARWEQRFARHCTELLKLVESSPENGEAAINRLVALDVFRRLLLVGGEGSGAFANATTPMFERINSAALDFMAPWYLEGDKRGEAAEAAARALLPSTSEFRQVLGEAGAEFERFRSPPPTVEWVGLFNASRAGRVPIQLQVKPTGEGRLVVVADGTGEFVSVGNLRGGELHIGNVATVATGSPVFLISK
jgi:hypothetical protein